MINETTISHFLESRVAAGDFPSASYLVAEKGEVRFRSALGRAVVEPEEIAATVDTIYDLASLTKVLVTGLLLAKLVERNEVALETWTGFYLSEFEEPPALASGTWNVTVGQLATHSSSFEAWKPFYLMVNERRSILREIARMSPKADDPPRVTYSDLNFITLTFLIERIYGKRIDDVARREIFEPLGLENTFYNPAASLKSRIAASENGNMFEMNTCLEQGFEIRDPQSRIRHRLVWGEVHDGNCWFMDGVSGHAGLFSTAFETFRIARQFLASSTELLKPETCALFRKNMTPGMNEARSLAFQLAETPESTASKALSPDSFGHLGFTGTSLWIEPEKERIFILLTNRTHHRQLPFENINSVRRRFHELATEALDSRND